MRCIGAPVFNSANQVVAGISISGPVARMDDQSIADLGKATAKCGQDISRLLGATVVN
jgi:DNA-binding IclR family transcriptional regulator